MNSGNSINDNQDIQNKKYDFSAVNAFLDVQNQNQKVQTENAPLVQNDKIQNKFQFINQFTQLPNTTDKLQTNNNKKEAYNPFAFNVVKKNENTAQKDTEVITPKLFEDKQNDCINKFESNPQITSQSGFKPLQIPQSIAEQTKNQQMPFQFSFSENKNTQNILACNQMKSTTEKPARPFMFSWYKTQIKGQDLKINNDITLSSLQFMQEFPIEYLVLEFCPKIIYDLKSETITEIKINHCPQIQNMKWIQHVPNLRILSLLDICVQDLNGLEMCKNFVSLFLTNCQINDISALKSTNLSVLSIDDNQCVSLNVLSEIQYLTHINALDISNCDITDISFLQSLQSIQMLCFQANLLCDISPLSKLTTITTIFLQYNKLQDISPLGSLVNLIELKIGYNQVTDISALKNMKQLTTLYVDANALKDISVVAYLPCLDTLDVSDNFGVNIEPLQNKTKMIYLFLRSINLRDIYALRNMINLKLLDLSHNYLIDISVLQKFQSLESLDLSFNKIEDFKVFQSGTHAEKQDFCYLLTDQSRPNIMDLLVLNRIQQINNQNGSIQQVNKRYSCLKKEFESKFELVQNQIQIAGKIQSSFKHEVAKSMNIICDEIYQ
ncbi:leucine-rich_repeat domain-containing protein [Hexamita inflata]|uniref:Leucine-rich repeat domain-containing protein n=1 Tax=Hexamita inflata TaxID=28002 RepID=A0AA86VTI3_9EUKA|nr:leucine-rich repeat domain-containing protein [Hexamita inflata]